MYDTEPLGKELVNTIEDYCKKTKQEVRTKKAETFNHEEFIKTIRHFPIDFEKVDKMLALGPDLSRCCYDKEFSHNFLAEAMDYVNDGWLKASYEFQEDVYGEYLYYVIKKILELGYDLSTDNWRTQDVCFNQLYLVRRNDYGPEIIKLFLKAGADIDRIFCEEGDSEERQFTVNEIKNLIGFPENSVFDDCNLSAMLEILYSAKNNQPYEEIHTINSCIGLRIRDVYIGEDLQVLSKAYSSKSQGIAKKQYRVTFTTGEQLIVNSPWQAYMNPYDETRLVADKIENMDKCNKAKIIKLRTFLSENSRGFYHLSNLWLYLDNSYILKFFEYEDDNGNVNTDIKCEIGKVKC